MMLLPVVLFGAGMGEPGNLESCIERRYFSRLHYLALVCSDTELSQRLQARPHWRQSGNQAFIESQLSFNRWFVKECSRVNPPVELLDTPTVQVGETTAQVAAWIARNIVC